MENLEHSIKDLVLKTLNILHKKFQIGIKLQYLVVVGYGKSYDHLIKSKSEYGGSLSSFSNTFDR
jgi:hypothetical protein